MLAKGPDVLGGSQPMSKRSTFKGSDLENDAARQSYRVQFPKYYNMATDTVSRHASDSKANAVALICDDSLSSRTEHTFRELDDASNRMAAFLSSQSVGPRDVVICYASQGFLSAVVHLAIYKLGAICTPLSLLYGPRTVEHAIRDSGARVLIGQGSAIGKLSEGDVDLSALSLIIAEDTQAYGQVSFNEALATDASAFRAVKTKSSDPALLLYTSGSTGLPKGILHAHRFLLGYLASVSLFYELQMEEPGQVLWTPSDWSWIAGIVNVMMTGWHFGHAVVAGQSKFSAEWAFDFLARNHITHTFLTPTALKRMSEVRYPRDQWPDLALRAIGTGGEPLPSAVLDWGQEVLQVPVNEFYGLTEVNHLIGNSQRLYPVRPGSMGKVYPGHTIEVIDETGNPVPDGTTGEIAARDDDPTLFLGYWNQPERTAEMRTGHWVRTGDIGARDTDGYFWYHGRNDDLIKCAGYRIGPAEIEDTLVRHAYVAEAAVVGRRDDDRGQVAVAFVRLADGNQANDTIAEELRQWVKTHLAVYKAPHEIIFVTSYPMTSTGKISRKELRNVAEKLKK